MNEVKEYYIKGEHYDWVTRPRRLEKIFHRRRERQTARLIRRFDSGTRVLDAGCGTGLITRNLSGEGVLGVDINAWNLQQARLHAPDAGFVTGDAENLPLASSSFDLALCTETLEHLNEPEKAVSELVRVLRPGGRLIGSVPRRHVIWRLRKMLLTTCPVSEPFHHNYSVAEVKAMLEGFEPVLIRVGLFGLNVFFVADKPAA